MESTNANDLTAEHLSNYSVTVELKATCLRNRKEHSRLIIDDTNASGLSAKQNKGVCRFGIA